MSRRLGTSATSYSQTGIFYKSLSHGSSQVEDAGINRVQELEQHSLRSAQHISVSARFMAERGQLAETQQSLVFHTLQLSFLFLFNMWPSTWRKGEYLCDPPRNWGESGLSGLGLDLRVSGLVHLAILLLSVAHGALLLLNPIFSISAWGLSPHCCLRFPLTSRQWKFPDTVLYPSVAPGLSCVGVPSTRPDLAHF